MIKIGILTVLAVLCLTVHSETITMQQNLNNPQCAKWNQDGTLCLQCAFRAFYNPVLNICEKVNFGCKTWDLGNGECIACFDGYGDAVKGGNAINGLCPVYNSSFIPSDPNCKCFTERGQCKQCFEGFYLNEKGICNFLIANCTATDNLGNCIACYDGMFVDQNGECEILPDNCTRAVTDVVCIECNPGFYIDLNGACEQLPLGCVLANPEGLCTKCGNGSYIDNNGECRQLPANCTTADTSGNCTACDRGFRLDSVTALCELISRDNCANLNEQGICIQCYPGSYIDEEGHCELLPANCVEANKNGECVRCALGYEETEKKLCGLLPVGCAATNSDGSCANCVQGWIKDISNNCVELLPGCATGDLNGICTSCLPGYYQALKGNCEWLTPNCNRTDSDGVCVFCNDGYTLSNSSKECQQNIILQSTYSGSIYNCRLANNYGVCLSCRKYYTLSNGACLPTGQNPKCQKFAKNLTCINCYYPNKYYLDNNNICSQRKNNCRAFDIKSGGCTQCYNYFYGFNEQCLTPEEYDRTVKSSGCAQINSKDWSCEKCLPGWIFISYSNCVKLIQGCATGDLNGTCRSCLPGYYRATKRTCEWLTPNCIKTDTDGLCILCQDGYTLLGDSKECRQNLAQQTQLSGVAPDCRLKNSKGKCTSCRKYYTLKNGTCTPTQQNPKCETFSQDYTCTKCYYSDKYYLDNNNICEQHESNCKAFDRQTGDCTECYSGLTLYNGQCVANEQSTSSL